MTPEKPLFLPDWPRGAAGGSHGVARADPRVVEPLSADRGADPTPARWNAGPPVPANGPATAPRDGWGRVGPRVRSVAPLGGGEGGPSRTQARARSTTSTTTTADAPRAPRAASPNPPLLPLLLLSLRRSSFSLASGSPSRRTAVLIPQGSCTRSSAGARPPACATWTAPARA